MESGHSATATLILTSSATIANPQGEQAPQDASAAVRAYAAAAVWMRPSSTSFNASAPPRPCQLGVLLAPNVTPWRDNSASVHPAATGAGAGGAGAAAAGVACVGAGVAGPEAVGVVAAAVDAGALA